MPLGPRCQSLIPLQGPHTAPLCPGSSPGASQNIQTAFQGHSEFPGGPKGLASDCPAEDEEPCAQLRPLSSCRAERWPVSVPAFAFESAGGWGWGSPAVPPALSGVTVSHSLSII